MWFNIIKDYTSIANSLIQELSEFKPKIVGSVGKKENPKDIDLLFPLNVNWNKLNERLNSLGWKLRYAQLDEFNGDIFWNYEKKIKGEFVGLDVFIGE
tara:strand:- start:530 stop:823 length:294 start_codon:yes stop_codon:yes gene_type:complete